MLEVNGVDYITHFIQHKGLRANLFLLNFMKDRSPIVLCSLLEF